MSAFIERLAVFVERLGAFIERFHAFVGKRKDNHTYNSTSHSSIL
ncbi:hypothetical protein [Allobacillus halotolerans]|nr:hypothetical protein [Allobacillus halotolerans]